MKLDIDDKRTWIEDTLHYMKDKDNKELYIEDYGSNIKELSKDKVEELFKLMLDNGDIDLSDLAEPDVYGW